ncbi:Rha family transcriptional regulator [Nitratiruptor sp. YY08-10]|uniref:Rha family transcriptional regulator n=1 Tax=Nitratiruptor sp. YY08-10 TaxID=2724897 RepID=UPI0019162ECA|nr:Rha family transcriptional regulator [Nitratiruptor sp. YY08-10]BCD59591.1 phage antirepressor protein [Nitratiruptor sp. YY08-10]BCD83067.1 phage antirepressor protein [Nitratiruptor phage NrS-2]
MDVVKDTTIVKVFNGVPSVSHIVIATLSDNNIESISRLIRQHKSDFELFGTLNYELIKVKAGRGASRKKIYWLNEQQSYLLLTYLKNTKEVRDFKIRLIKEYFEFRQKATQPPANCPAERFDARINGYKSQLAQRKKQIEELQWRVLSLEEELKRYKQGGKYILLEHNVLDLAGSYARLREQLIGTAESLEYIAKNVRDRIETVDQFIKAIEKTLPKSKNVVKSATKHIKTQMQWQDVFVKNNIK